MDVRFYRLIQKEFGSIDDVEKNIQTTESDFKKLTAEYEKLKKFYEISRKEVELQLMFQPIICDIAPEVEKLNSVNTKYGAEKKGEENSELNQLIQALESLVQKKKLYTDKLKNEFQNFKTKGYPDELKMIVKLVDDMIDTKEKLETFAEFDLENKYGTIEDLKLAAEDLEHAHAPELNETWEILKILTKQREIKSYNDLYSVNLATIETAVKSDKGARDVNLLSAWSYISKVHDATNIASKGKQLKDTLEKGISESKQIEQKINAGQRPDTELGHLKDTNNELQMIRNSMIEEINKQVLNRINASIKDRSAQKKTVATKDYNHLEIALFKYANILNLESKLLSEKMNRLGHMITIKASAGEYTNKDKASDSEKALDELKQQKNTDAVKNMTETQIRDLVQTGLVKEILKYTVIANEIDKKTLTDYMKQVYDCAETAKLGDENTRDILFNLYSKKKLYLPNEDTDGELINNDDQSSKYGSKLIVKGNIRGGYFVISSAGKWNGRLVVKQENGRQMIQDPNNSGPIWVAVGERLYLLNNYQYRKGKIYHYDAVTALSDGRGGSYKYARLNLTDKEIDLDNTHKLFKAFLSIMENIPNFFNDLEYVKNGLKQLSDMITEVERHLETNKNTNDISVFDSSVKKIKDNLKQAEAALAEEEGKTDKDAGAIAEYKRRVTFYSRKLDREIKKVKDSIQNNIDSLEKLRVFIGRVQAL